MRDASSRWVRSWVTCSSPAVDGAESLRQVQQLGGDPARYVQQDPVCEHGLGAARPSRKHPQQLRSHLRATRRPAVQRRSG